MLRNDWPKLPPPGTTASQLASIFDHGVEKVGSLFVVVPKKVKLFPGAPNTPPEDAEPTDSWELAREFSRTLTANQWKQLSSQEGLGLDNLNPAQQKLYLLLLPDPMRFRPMSADGSVMQEPFELTDEQRRQVRVVMDRNLSIYMVGEGSEPSLFGFTEPVGKRGPKLYLESEGNEQSKQTERYAPKVPNKLKPSDLNFAARSLDGLVSLKDVKTLGELMERVRDATGQSLIVADARLHKLTVKIWGEQARSGDVLKALCRSLGGTFRRVGEGEESFFVLTEDRVGLGTRLAAYQSWRNLGQQLRSADRQSELDKSAKDLDFKKLTTVDDPWGLPVEVHNKADRMMFSTEDSKWEDQLTSVSSLPAAVQEQVKTTSQQRERFMVSDGAGGVRPARPRTDKVSLQSSYRVRLLVPGKGLADAWQLSSLTSGPQMSEYLRNPPKPKVSTKPLRFPEKWKERVVLARPKDEAECATLAKAAKESGFSAIWLDLPPDLSAARKILVAAVAAGKDAGVSVGAQVSVFRTAVPEAPLDLTIQGEPSDAEPNRTAQALAKLPNPELYSAFRTPGVYLEPNPQNFAALTRELTLLARTPGLSALVLTALVPPGYVRQTDRFISFGNAELGYTLQNRLEFLRQESIDPIDLTRGGDIRLMPTYFAEAGPNYINLGNGQYGPDPKFKNPSKLWSEFRAKTIEGLTAPLYQKLRSAAPELRLFVDPGDSDFSNFYGEWLKPDAKPATVANPWDDSQKITRARGFSTFILNRFSYYDYGMIKDDKLRDEYRKSIRADLRRQTTQFGPAASTWNGFVVDASSAAVSRLAEALGHYKEDPK